MNNLYDAITSLHDTVRRIEYLLQIQSNTVDLFMRVCAIDHSCIIKKLSDKIPVNKSKLSVPIDSNTSYPVLASDINKAIASVDLTPLSQKITANVTKAFESVKLHSFFQKVVFKASVMFKSLKLGAFFKKAADKATSLFSKIDEISGIPIQERLAAIGNSIEESLFAPVDNKVSMLFDNVLTFFEVHKKSVEEFCSIIGGAVSLILDPIIALFNSVLSVANEFINKVREGNPVFTGLAIVIGSLAAVIAVYNAIQSIAGIFATIWSIAQGKLNLALLANPITWIIAGIIALIAIISYVVYATEGWGETWDNLVTYLKLGMEAFVAYFQDKWMEFENSFLSGLELIEKGWYKIQSLWDKDEANNGLAQLQEQQNKRSKEVAAAHNKYEELTQQMESIKIWQVRGNGKTPKDFMGEMKNKFGVNTALQESANGGVRKTEQTATTQAATTEAISSGGTRISNISIQFKNLVENIIFQGTTSENRHEIERNLAESMFRVLNMAQSSVS